MGGEGGEGGGEVGARIGEFFLYSYCLINISALLSNHAAKKILRKLKGHKQLAFSGHNSIYWTLNTVLKIQNVAKNVCHSTVLQFLMADISLNTYARAKRAKNGEDF